MPQYNYTFWRVIKQHITLGSVCMQNGPVHKKATPGVLRWLAFNWKTRQKEADSCRHSSCSPSALIVRFLFIYLFFDASHRRKKWRKLKSTNEMEVLVIWQQLWSKHGPHFCHACFLHRMLGLIIIPEIKKIKIKIKKTRGNKLINSHGVGWYKPCECDAISGATN